MKIFAHHERNVGKNAVPIIQEAVNKDLTFYIVAQAQVTAALYVMHEAIVHFDTPLGNISYFASGQGQRKTDKEGGRRKWMHKQWESLCFSFEFMVFLWVYGCPLGLWFSFGFMVFPWVDGFPLGLRLYLSFRLMSCLCSFGSAYMVIWKRWGLLCTQWQGGFVMGKSVSHHHHRFSASQGTEQQRLYGDPWMMEMDWAIAADGDTGVRERVGVTGSIYSGDDGVYRTSGCIIISYIELHTLSFPTFDLTRSCRDFFDSQAQVVSYFLTLFLSFSNQSCVLWWIPVGLPWEVRQSVDDGLAAF